MDILRPGQMLGAYRIINQIGQGGMATVYKAYQASMDRNVAIKVLPSHLAENKEFAGRFQQEARIIANLEHPHILPVFDSGESEGISYLVMRYLEAGTLKEKMEAAPLSGDELDRIFVQLADALGYAHSHGVIHRDLKPSNVLIDSQGNLFLTDFGIAKLLEGTSHFTKTDTVMGTPAYISPEQAQGLMVDQRSDIYSLGIILYEMVTGRVPFMADTPLAVILKHVSDPLPLPSVIKPGISPFIEQVILKALAKSPQDRFRNTDDFIAAWKRAREASQSAASISEVEVNTMRYTAAGADGKPVERVSGTQQANVSKRSSRGWLIGCLAGAACLLFSIGGTALFMLNGVNPPAENIPSGKSSEDRFEIEIGDEVSADQPDAGAGSIEAPGSTDIYTFSAEPGEKTFVHIIDAPKSGDTIIFSLTDDQNFNVFSSCLQCGDPGVVVLESGGEYTITVGDENPEGAGFGGYKFKLWDVPPPEEFPIQFEELISRDDPGTGAGFIESPGAQDVYKFTAEPGQDIYFQVVEPPTTSDLIYWGLYDESQNSLFETCLQCGDPGLIKLDAGGQYTIVIGGGIGYGIGVYSIKIWDVPSPDIFEIQIGDSISTNKPAPGAGMIETPGSHDIYTFSAAAGETVVFSVQKTPATGDTISWRLEDENENEFFNTCLGCGDQQVTFEKDGTYSIIVGSDTTSGMGAYEIRLFFP